MRRSEGFDAREIERTGTVSVPATVSTFGGFVRRNFFDQHRFAHSAMRIDRKTWWACRRWVIAEELKPFEREFGTPEAYPSLCSWCPDAQIIRHVQERRSLRRKMRMIQIHSQRSRGSYFMSMSPLRPRSRARTSDQYRIFSRWMPSFRSRRRVSGRKFVQKAMRSGGRSKAIHGTEGQSLRQMPSLDVQLMTKDQYLSFQRSPRPEQ